MYVLFKFNAIKLSRNHVFILQIAVFSPLWSWELFKLLINKLVSSANIIVVAVGSTTLGRSLTYIKNSKDPKMEPWGNSCVTVVLLDRVLMFENSIVISTIGYLLPRYDSSNVFAFPFMP